MLKGIDLDILTPFDLVADALVKAPYTFHLTGSRYFGYHTQSSDWDFFVEVPDEEFHALRVWLTAHGFKKESNSSYIPSRPDPLNETLEVWAHKAANIHVQMVRGAETKRAIQEAIRSLPWVPEFLRCLTKDERGFFWKVSRAIYFAGLQTGNQS